MCGILQYKVGKWHSQFKTQCPCFSGYCKDPPPPPGSVIRRQAEELRPKLLHAPESQRGSPGKAGVQVVVGNHHHLHPRRQCRLHAVGRVFKHQALSEGQEREGNKAMLSYKPIRVDGIPPGKTNMAKRGVGGDRPPFPFSTWWTWHRSEPYCLPLPGEISI